MTTKKADTKDDKIKHTCFNPPHKIANKPCETCNPALKSFCEYNKKVRFGENYAH